MDFTQHEPIAGKRTLNVVLRDSTGVGISDYTGITVKISKGGANYTTPSGGTITAQTGGPTGAAKIVFAAADFDTVGAFAFSITKSSVGLEYNDSFVIDPNASEGRLIYCQAAGGAAGSVDLDTGVAVASDGYYAASTHSCVVMIVDGTGKGQSRIGTNYTSANRRITVSPNWGTNPDSTSVVVVLPYGDLSSDALTAVASKVWDITGLSSHRAAGSFGELIQRVFGSLHLNSMLDNFVYGASNVVTSARLRVFADATALGAATPGNSNGTDSEIFRYTVTAVDAGSGQISSFKLTQGL